MNEEEFLDSWKKISAHLGKEVRTCRRWEKQLGLPIHRIDKNSHRSGVFAYRSEINQWLRERAYDEKTAKGDLAWKNKWLTLGLIFIIACLSTFLAISYLRSKPKLVSRLFEPEYPSIAVLPFENASPTKYDEYLSEGITKEFVKNLAISNRIKLIQIPSIHPTSSPELKKACQRLKADYILLGELKNRDKTLTLNVQLLRTQDDAYVWKTKVEGSLKDFKHALNDLSHKIHGLLRINAENEDPPVSNDKENNNSEAFDSYLKGNYILSNIVDDNPWMLYHQGKYYGGQCTVESNDFAIKLFSQAVEIDPNFALAYIGLAQCYTNYVNFNWQFDRRWLTKAEELVEKSLKMGPSPPEYYSTLMEIYLVRHIGLDENLKDALFKLAEEGLRKYPNDAQINSIVGYLHFLEFGEEGSKAAFKKALEYKEKSFWLDPYNTGNIVFTELLMLNKDFSRAAEVCNIIINNDRSPMTKFRLGEILYYSGDLKKSEEIFRQFDTPPEYKMGGLCFLGMILSQKGEKDSARKIIQELSELFPKEYNIFDGNLKLASIYMGLGERNEARIHLRTFFESSRMRKMRHVYYRYLEIDNNFRNLDVHELVS
jgi:TolB-like protein